MEVYIEFAIIDNFVMDFLLLKSAARLTRTRVKTLRVLLGAITGTLVAIILPIFNMPDAVMFFLKIILGLLVCLVGAEHKSLFAYLRFFNIFLLLTFAVGGAIIGSLSLMGVDYSVKGVKNAGVLPVGVNLLFGYFCYLFVKKLIERTQKKIERGYNCDVIIRVKNKSVSIKGFVDSGNMLIDAKTALPIIVCSKKIIEQLFGEDAVPMRYMPINTASGFGLLSLYEIDSVTAITENKRTVSDAVLGMTTDTLNLVDGADVIVSTVLI